MIWIPIRWHQATGASNPQPSVWIVYGWQTSASQPRGPLTVYAL